MPFPQFKLRVGFILAFLFPVVLVGACQEEGREGASSEIGTPTALVLSSVQSVAKTFVQEAQDRVTVLISGWESSDGDALARLDLLIEYSRRLDIAGKGYLGTLVPLAGVRTSTLHFVEALSKYEDQLGSVLVMDAFAVVSENKGTSYAVRVGIPFERVGQYAEFLLEFVLDVDGGPRFLHAIPARSLFGEEV